MARHCDLDLWWWCPGGLWPLLLHRLCRLLRPVPYLLLRHFFENRKLSILFQVDSTWYFTECGVSFIYFFFFFFIVQRYFKVKEVHQKEKMYQVCPPPPPKKCNVVQNGIFSLKFTKKENFKFSFLCLTGKSRKVIRRKLETKKEQSQSKGEDSGPTVHVF